MMLGHNIPGTHTLERVDELQEFVNNFPESKLTPIFQREIDELWMLLEQYGIAWRNQK